jgi:ATP-binding protein involved in chromosome partitioning
MTAMTTPDRSLILAALDRVIDPKSGKGLVAAGLVQGLVVAEGRAGFMMEVAPADIDLYAPIHRAAENALRSVPGVERAQVALTADAGGRDEPYAPPPGAVRVRRGARLSDEAKASATPARPPAPGANPAHVRHIIAISSAKGGVGKSTAAVSLAVAFARAGYNVGLLDADVYGPSLPRMLGSEAEPSVNAEKKLVPINAHGLKVMSIGFIVDEGSPMIWRGPMASSAINQMTGDVAWGTADKPLDLLVIDMPPGTGDIQLTLAQKLSIDGAVLISTPQEIALIDVRRGASMFRKTGVRILGVIENMAYFPDPATGARIPIFGEGGARRTAEALEAPFLGEVPIDIALREACDAGTPLAISRPDSPTARLFDDMARRLAADIGL